MLDQKHLFKHKKKFLTNDSIKGNKATDDSSRSSQKKKKQPKKPPEQNLKTCRPHLPS